MEFDGLVSIDTETNGTDLNYGNKPYLVSICGEEEQRFWEWDVNPLTREPEIPEGDIDEIVSALSCKKRVLHNTVFDVKALSNIRESFGEGWEWEITHDTLMASHILATNKPHDLTSLAMEYLGIDLLPFEERIRTATHKARTLAKSKKPDWRIAAPGLSELPSVKSSGSRVHRGTEEESYWKADMWLPRAFVTNEPDLLPEQGNWRHGNDPENHPWATVCCNYANSDTGATLALHNVLMQFLRERSLERIYITRLKLMRVIFLTLQDGISINMDRLTDLQEDYQELVQEASTEMVRIADQFGYSLEVPKGANNDSLRRFCFGYSEENLGNGVTNCRRCEKPWPKTKRGEQRWKQDRDDDMWYCSKSCFDKRKSGDWLNLPVVQTTDAGKPSTNAKAIQIYEYTLEGTQKAFIDHLRVKRKLGKSLEYVEIYKKFQIRQKENWSRLYPSLNPCGTDTLRTSSTNPSQQVISMQKDPRGRNLRYAFGPEPGRIWYSLDYSNLELRIPAYECGESAMLELFENPKDPPYYGSYHLLIFSILHPDKYDRDDPDGLIKAKDAFKDTWYQWTKNGNFAELYGAVDTGDGKGTADIAFHVPGAQSIISKRLKQKASLNRSWINFARKHGYVETIPDKTVDPQRGYPILCRRSQFGDIVPTQPLNYHVQGTACWVKMMAMIKIQELLDEWNHNCYYKPQYRMIMDIHDELVFDFPQNFTPKGVDKNLPRIRAIKMAMESTGKNVGVILTCGSERHSDYWSKGQAI